MTPSILQDGVDILCNPPNGSVLNGGFFETLKVAKIIHLYKANDATQHFNFRPMSLLSVFAKVIARVVKEQIYRYVENNNILTEYQYRFRKW